MKKSLIAILIVTLILLTIFIFQRLFLGGSYSINRKQSDQCIKMNGQTEEIATSLVKGLEGCRIIRRGQFKDEPFIALNCKTEQGESYNQFLFGSKESCHAFKDLNSVEYIKLMLQTMLPSN